MISVLHVLRNLWVCILDILILQTIQFLLMIMLTSMTALPIAFQAPLKDFIGVDGCYAFWVAQICYLNQTVVSGTGMGAFRIICLRNLFPTVDKGKLVKYILAVQFACAICLTGMLLEAIILNGWERVIFYQFCMGLGSTSADVINIYENKHFDEILAKRLRQMVVFISQICIIVELLMYVWIIKELWSHDKTKHQEGIITKHMREERNRKNVITIYGQIASFVTELIGSVYIMIHVANESLTDPSVMPISTIIIFFFVSLSQFFTSHELRRFVRAEWNIRIFI